MKRSKRLSRIFLCTALILSLLSSGLSAFAENEIILGDINGDNTVTTDDAIEVLKMASGIALPNLERADINGDGMVTLSDARSTLRKALGLFEMPSKNGENMISTDPNNRFIAFISENYNVKPGALVAIYANPPADNNFVLQFKKKSLLGNEYGRSPDDLEKVYQVDLNNGVKIATKTGIGAVGCSSAESILIFNLVKTVMMPQEPDVFDVE